MANKTRVFLVCSLHGTALKVRPAQPVGFDAPITSIAKHFTCKSGEACEEHWVLRHTYVNWGNT